MNVALILTGHLRCWEQANVNTKKYIIDRYNPDIFIHSWDEEGWWDPHSKEGFYNDSPKIDFNTIKETYKPINAVLENFEDFRVELEKQAEKYEKHFHVKRNILSMFYKCNRGIDLMNKHTALTGKQYDLVIRMRPDLVFEQELPDFDINKFYTIVHRNHLGQGTGDMFQASNQWLMTLFGNIPVILPQLYQRTGVLCPHIVLQCFFGELNLPWQEFFIQKKLMHSPYGEYTTPQDHKEKTNR